MNYLYTYIVAVLLVCCIRLINGDYVPPVPRDDDPKIHSRDVKCLGECCYPSKVLYDNLFVFIQNMAFLSAVCRATLVEMKSAIKKVDPRKKVEVSGFRMDSKDTKSVQLIRSESFLTELMESVCEYLIVPGSCSVHNSSVSLCPIQASPWMIMPKPATRNRVS